MSSGTVEPEQVTTSQTCSLKRLWVKRGNSKKKKKKKKKSHLLKLRMDSAVRHPRDIRPKMLFVCSSWAEFTRETGRT
ncbi:hypothetical protein F2P81_014326 [Scophthalmus maximus]|uniref:Uncharacterized protein n=1 Tax=Scophthalmus maximus TaxID=52904 RepID=A0A6A4SQT0_SCOMX|nr:hypothetical protein F2P81_014326 [Scophthalmus maximus]